MAKKARAKQVEATPVPSAASPRSLMARLAILQEEFAQEVRRRQAAIDPQPAGPPPDPAAEPLSEPRS
jgi:hypothetical protein